jgi:ubiquitin carboxyl-terminal hydrolase 1
MNARREGADIFSNAPIHYASRSSYDESTYTTLLNSQTFAYALVAVFSVYLLLDHFGFTPISLIRLLWNVLVYLTPSRLVVALDSRMSYSDPSSPRPTQMTFHLKHEAMQRIFGLDNNSFPFFPRSRSLSGFGSALLGNTKDAIPSGLGNWDNSCYQNSIIQGLASLRSLSTFLGQNVDALGEKGPFSTHQALKGIIDLLNSASNYGSKLWIPADLKSMSSWQQQDAQEYFSKVVDQIDIEVQQASRRETKNMGLKMTGPEENILRDIVKNAAGTDEHEADPVIEKSSLRNPLEGLLAQRVGCMKCGYTEGLSLIPFNCLTVPLGGKFEYDIRECLDQYMTLEPIEGVECAKCTLLRAHEQLKSLLGSLSDDEGLTDPSQSAGLSDAVRTSAEARLEAVKAALEDDDFAENTLANKCHIPSKNKVSTTKSRQAVIARAPQCLAVHINRSLFDEMTGMLKKNLAAVKFPKTLDLNDWCLGTRIAEESGDAIERWVTSPSETMLPRPGETVRLPNRQYELRAIITHYGRHENGHYICYRKYPTSVFSAPVPDEVLQAEGDKEKSERWYRLSDDDVQMVSEANVMSQGGAFMLFYEAIDSELSAQAVEPAKSESAQCDRVESNSSHTMSEDMSTTSTSTDLESSTSRATSVSTPDRNSLPIDDTKVTIPLLEVSNAADINTRNSGDAHGSPFAIPAS